MKKTAKIFTGLILVASLALTACGAKNNNTGGSSPAPSAMTSESTGAGPSESKDESGKGKKIGMVTDIGGVNDKSLNQSAWEGLQRLKNNTAADIHHLESAEAANFETNLNQLVQEQYDLAWGIGYYLEDAVKSAAEKNKDAKLAIVDGIVNAPNVASITFAENEGAFLVGVVAGLMTESDKIGFVGGAEIPAIKRFELGFVAGVKAVNPDADVQLNYTGAFDSEILGKVAATTLFNDGIDIIFHAARDTGNGVFNEAKARLKSGEKVWVIGMDNDQSLEFGDDVTLTSMLKHADEAVYRISKDMIDGKFPAGVVTTLGLKDNAIGLPETSKKNVPSDVLAQVEAYTAKIISGEITVPTVTE